MTGLKPKVSTCCPVCGTWFYREPGTRQKYDKDLCRRIGVNKTAAIRRAKAKGKVK